MVVFEKSVNDGSDEIKMRNTLQPFTETDIEKIENEDKNQPLNLLERIDRIVNIHSFMQKQGENIEEKTKHQKNLDEHLAVCSGILEISANQTLLFAYILNNNKIKIEKLAVILRVTRIQCLMYLDDLDTLLKKRLIRKSNEESEWDGCSEFDYDYWIPLEVIKSLRDGIPFRSPHHYNLSRDEFFEHMVYLLKMINKREISKEDFYMDFSNLLKDNTQLEFVKNLLKLSLSEENTILFSFICDFQYYHSLIRSSDKTRREFRISGIKHILRNILNENELNLDQLLEKKLIKYSRDDFNDKTKIMLTRKTITELLGITLPKNSKHDLMNHESIISKELFYNEKEGKLVEQLTDLLSESNYKNVVEGLKTKKMRTGFNCLFFGAPGTGKTETALQIARISGRDIMSIDISTTKSKWFGESEKIVKDVFVQYRRKVGKAKNMNVPVPILLLNEADAVINKRKNTSISGVAQTENAIQNIILEEFERLEGIIIATTNLTENIDIAFDRRFIYKIEFKKPDVKVKQSIWKSLIPELTEAEALKLAETFELSGGQIENIARKRTITGVLNKNEPDISELISLCGDESILKNEVKIGF